MRKSSLIILLVSLVIGFLMVLAIIPSSTSVNYGARGSAFIKPATFVRSLRQQAYCTIRYEPKSGQPGTIVLWQDAFDGPTMLLPAKNTNILLCLYDFDIDYRLLRIDTSKSFTPLLTSNDLSRILFKCDWLIGDGTTSDWQEVLTYLHEVPHRVIVHKSVPIPLRFNVTPESILKRLANQGIKLDTNY